MRLDRTKLHDVVFAAILAALGVVVAYALYRLSHQPYSVVLP